MGLLLKNRGNYWLDDFNKGSQSVLSGLFTHATNELENQNADKAMQRKIDALQKLQGPQAPQYNFNNILENLSTSNGMSPYEMMVLPETDPLKPYGLTPKEKKDFYKQADFYGTQPANNYTFGK